MTGEPATRRGGKGGESATEAALRYLARCSRTTSELRSHLARRGHAPGPVSEAIEKLTRLGYLDDRALVERYALKSLSEKPLGLQRLRRDLTRRGVDRETIETTLGTVFGRAEEARALRRALETAAGRLGGRPAPVERRRIASHLMRRGFRPEDVREAVEAWWRSLGAEQEEAIDGAGEDELE